MDNKYNDYELIDVISENNEEALELIINKYQPIIKYIANKKLKIASNLGMDISDLYQEGLIGLLEAIRDFKDTKKVSFYTFASLCIERQMNTSLTKHNRKRDQILNNAISLDKKIVDSEKTLLEIVEPINNITALNDIIALESETELYTNIKNELSEFEKKVFDLKINNYSCDEIASKLNVTSKKIYSAMRRIKDKIKKQINIK